MSKLLIRIILDIFIQLLIAANFIFITSCQYNSEREFSPKAINGILDLKNWDLEKNGPVDLTGEWKFYWNKHLTPADFTNHNSTEKTGHMNVPGCWNGYILDGEPLSGDGYATYRLKILMHDQQGSFAFNKLDIGTAFSIYVNGKKISSAGVAGESAETTVPYFHQNVSAFTSEKNTVDIVLQVSNFHHRLGGLWEVIRLGKEKDIRNIREKRLIFNIFICGSISIIGLYHLFLFFLGKKDRSPLYFGIFCFLISVRLLATGDRYLIYFFPDINWEIMIKVEYLTFYLAVPLFATFIYSIFNQEFSKRVLKIILLLGVLFSCIVLLTPAKVYSHTVHPFQIITILSSVYAIYVLTLSLIRKKEGAFLFSLGFSIFFITIVNDILYSRMMTQIGYFAPLGLFIFIFFQALLLSRRFSNAFDTVEKQGQKLKETIRAYKQEIIERKRTEKALQEANSIINRSPAVAFLWKNSEGWPVEFVSDNVIELFGYSARELISGQVSYAQTVHPDDLERVAKEVEVYSGDKTRTGFFHEPYRVITKDGKVKWLDDRTYIRRDDEGNVKHYEGIVVDITDSMQAAEALRANEEKLARSKKMESLGLLAGGVAHDLNNVLSGLVSYPDLLLMQMAENDQFRKAIQTIKESGDRAAAIVQDLLTVARGVATTNEPMNLNDLIDGYIDSPEFNRLKEFHPRVSIKTNLDVNLLNISGSHTHIRKAVMNLVSNAAESINDNGNVAISTVNRYLDKPLKGYDHILAGEYAVMSVSDSGSGISSDDIERIFEPFYTKKIMGRSGTGLGLAVVWNVVQDHKGYIDVTSNKNGTTFELFFPITREKISRNELAIPLKDLKACGEKILVIDDVKSQRDISCQILETFGYKTSAVSSGEEAVEYLKKNSVDLILLDMIMDPGINGRETYDRIIKIHPGQKAIIVSGFAETEDVKETQKLGAGKFIKKPLTIEQIGLAVKEELEKSKSVDDKMRTTVKLGN
jgi:PAS domain S-box-containing protein